MLSRLADDREQEQRLKKLLRQGPFSPPVFRLVESLDAFIDYGPAFQEYLAAQGVPQACTRLGLNQRKRHSIHAKVG